MKISINWLSEYVDHSLPVEELTDLLTMAGLEVDDVLSVGSDLEGVVVGEVLAAGQHPNADRLSVCKVDIGEEEPVQIVCGAPNVAAGQKVPVATSGTTLMLPSRDDPDTRVAVKIKRTKLRGEESNGMICAEDELGLGDDHDGIMVLDQDARVGQSFGTFLEQAGLEVSDTVLDVAITPNRPDAISHIGMARDIAALKDLALKKPVVEVPTEAGAVQDAVSVSIKAPAACRRYVALLIKGITVKESPTWLKQRLTAIGLRPRNNIVDITNYVMFECGQPLHAFDYDEIAQNRIEVKFAKKGDVFTTLDSKKHTLPEDTLMICDGDRPVAIAGIMGGENSEVTDNTTNVLIESAYFDPSTIRRTAKALGMQTDASYRFERGVDPEGQSWAATRAANLMVELAGGSRVSGIVDAHPSPQTRKQIKMRVKRANAIIGIDVDGLWMAKMLERIGFDAALEAEVIHCSVPSFRPDIEREIDVIEEVARLYGYDNLPVPAHTPIPNILPVLDQARARKNRVTDYLVGQGFRELRVNSMLRSEVAELFNDSRLTGMHREDDIVETLKPISQEMAALRPSLLPGMLSVMQHNQNHGQRILRFWELGHVFYKTEKSHTYIPGYTERESLIIGLSGPAVQGNWDTEERIADFSDLLGLIEGLLAQVHMDGLIGKARYEPTPIMQAHVELSYNGKRIGLLGEVSSKLIAEYNLKESVLFAELDWDAIASLTGANSSLTYSPVSRYPAVERDLALVMSITQEVGDVIKTIKKAGGSLLQRVTVFDVYQGDKIDAGKKSVAFGLRFGADRTLKDKEVEKAMKKILSSMEKEFGATLRA